MKKSKILVPIATIGTLATTITPMSLLTSCSNIKIGKDANLVNDYVCQLKPIEEKTYTKEEALDAYLEADATIKIDDEGHNVINDDLRYSSSLALKTNDFKKHFNASNCTLGIKDVEIDTINKTILPTFVYKFNGDFYDKLGTDILEIKDADIQCELRPTEPLKFEFCSADSTTKIKQNYIKLYFGKPLFWQCISMGKFVMNGQLEAILCPVRWSYMFGEKPEKIDRKTIFNTYVYFFSQILFDELTCNLKNHSIDNDYGIWYTNYMSLAKIK